MEKITELLDNLDLAKFVPKLDTLLGWTQWLISLAVRIGPICIFVLGLIHLLIPPKEANWKAGYRTYFGMGSILAWRFTQRVSGLIMTLLGMILTIVAYVTVGKLSSMEPMDMVQTAFSCIKAQVVCTLIVFIVMFLLTAVVFDRKGNCRFPIPTTAPLCYLFPGQTPKKIKIQKDDIPLPQEILEEPVEFFEETPEFEQQGTQVITADDIVIEDLQ